MIARIVWSIVQLWVILVVAAGAEAQQLLEHPSQVQVKPPAAAPTEDAFRVWGGIKAGPTGEVLIIDENGVLQGIVPAAGSITFAQWDDNDCTANQFPYEILRPEFILLEGCNDSVRFIPGVDDDRFPALLIKGDNAVSIELADNDSFDIHD